MPSTKNEVVTSFSVDVAKRESSKIDKSKQITFCWDNLSICAKGRDARNGICGTKIGQRDFIPDKFILQNGSLFLKTK